MQSKLRVPEVPNKSHFALERWFYKLYVNGLLFHPDDLPEDMVLIATGERLFTPEECVVLDEGLAVLFEHHGDKVYEIGLKYFNKAMGFKPDYAEA